MNPSNKGICGKSPKKMPTIKELREKAKTLGLETEGKTKNELCEMIQKNDKSKKVDETVADKGKSPKKRITKSLTPKKIVYDDDENSDEGGDKKRKNEDLDNKKRNKTDRVEIVRARSPLKKTRTPGRLLNNNEIAHELRKLAIHFRLEKDVNRARVFNEAADVVEYFPEVIEDPETQLEDYWGIGPGVIKRVRELVDNGNLLELKDYDESLAESLTILNTVYGIGDDTATKLIEKGIRNLKDLVDNYNNGTIDLNQSQLIGVQYLRHFNQVIPKKEIEQISNYILNAVRTYNPHTYADIVGNYKRGQPATSVDILFSNPEKDQTSVSNLITYLQEQKFIQHILRNGPIEYTVTYYSDYPNKNGVLRKLNIKYTNPEGYVASLIRGTGPVSFVIEISRRAKDLGFSLTENGLVNKDPSINTEFGKDEVIPIHTEKQLFDILELEYLEPNLRI